MRVNAVIVGESKINAQFDELPSLFFSVVHDTIAELLPELEGRARAGAPHKTGALRQSIGSDIHDYETKIVGKVYSGMHYAPAQEFGVHKTVHVGGHRQRLSHVYDKSISTEEVDVDPYTRMASVEATRFLRDGLAGLEGEVVTALRRAIDSAAGEISHE